jgi:hypothetical protein
MTTEGQLDRKPKKSTRDLSDLRARLALATPQPALAIPPAAAPPGLLPLRLAQPRAIADSGPPVEIPTAQRSHARLIIAIVFVAAIPLGLGWACGRVFAARALYNKTIEDAGTIRAEVQPARS